MVRITDKIFYQATTDRRNVSELSSMCPMSNGYNSCLS